jgi:hypothetical protein
MSDKLILVSKNPIVERIAYGEADADLLHYLLSRKLPLSEEEYLEAIVFGFNYDLPKQNINPVFQSIPLSVKESYVNKKDANHRVVYYVMMEALRQLQAPILTGVVRNTYLPPEFVVKVAEKAPVEVLKTILDDQVRMLAFPEIIDTMRKNPFMTKSMVEKFEKLYKAFQESDAAQPVPEAAIDDRVLDVAQAEVERVEEGAKPAAKPAAEAKKKALGILQQLNQMGPTERIKLALTGSKMYRMLLLRDSNRMIVTAALQSPKITMDEVLMMVRDKSTAGEIIDKIAGHREWSKNYSVLVGLVQNPKTPLSKSMGMLKMLNLRDLKLLASDKNMNPNLRQLATQMHNQKEGVK